MEDTLRHRFTLLAALVTALVTIPFAAPANAAADPHPNPNDPGNNGPWNGPGDPWDGHWHGHGHAHDITFTAAMTGWNELPHGSGDRNGSGSAVFTLKPDNQLCYVLSTRDLRGQINAAHIHLGNNTKEGPVFVKLTAPTAGWVRTCQQVTTRVASALNEEPTNFYVNVHTTRFPDGAIRGQLQRG
jgi:hypothetical protein